MQIYVGFNKMHSVSNKDFGGRTCPVIAIFTIKKHTLIVLPKKKINGYYSQKSLKKHVRWPDISFIKYQGKFEKNSK